MPFLTNSAMLELDTLPRHLVIVGGSYIGLEFGQMFRRFGSEVTVVEMGPRLIGREDEDVSDGGAGDPGDGGHRRPPQRRMHPLRRGTATASR